MTFSVIEIDNCDKIEQLGTKYKFWFYDQDGKNIKLFKIGRPGTGENWSEKVTSELAKLLEIPCASYELAKWKGEQGIASPTFVPENGRLIHGNEILAKAIDHYETTKVYKARDYKLSTVTGILKVLKNNTSLPIGYNGNRIIKTISDVFVGYLMFDCLISNSDRHHENWGIVFDTTNKSIHLAPTYDHASGLGCRVSKDECNNRMTTSDQRYSVEYFVAKTKSAFFGKDNKRIKTFDAFFVVSKYNKEAANYWIDKISTLEEESIMEIFNQIPSNWINKYSMKFACRILYENKKRIVENRGLIDS